MPTGSRWPGTPPSRGGFGRSAPAPRPSVFGSCAGTGSNSSVFETIEFLEPIFFLHMGDLHYENIAENDVDRFRRAYDEVLSSERQSSLYRSAPIVYVWDDHDFGPNDSDRTHPGKAAGLRAYDENVPHYPLEPGEELEAEVTGRNKRGRLLEGMALRLRRRDGCEVIASPNAVPGKGR